MNANERVQLLELRIKKIKSGIVQQQEELLRLRARNKSLENELEDAKKANFELKKQIEIAKVANQLKSDKNYSKKLKQQITKYIREIDSVIEMLKTLE